MLFPDSWAAFESLVCGFGDRVSAPPVDTVRVRQVHGRTIVLCDTLGAGEHGDIEADGLIATRRGVFVAVKTADCVPILMVAPTRSRSRLWVAAVHAGWRGTDANVVGAAVSDALARGHDPRTLTAAIGPSIGGCCYQVDEDVASRFRRAGLPVVEGGAKPRLDLPRVNLELLLRAGLRAENLKLLAPCTRCDTSRYHSYRAAPGTNGRQLSWIGWRS